MWIETVPIDEPCHCDEPVLELGASGRPVSLHECFSEDPDLERRLYPCACAVRALSELVVNVRLLGAREVHAPHVPVGRIQPEVDQLVAQGDPSLLLGNLGHSRDKKQVSRPSSEVIECHAIAVAATRPDRLDVPSNSLRDGKRSSVAELLVVGHQAPSIQMIKSEVAPVSTISVVRLPLALTIIFLEIACPSLGAFQIALLVRPAVHH